MICNLTYLGQLSGSVAQDQQYNSRCIHQRQYPFFGSVLSLTSARCIILVSIRLTRGMFAQAHLPGRNSKPALVSLGSVANRNPLASAVVINTSYYALHLARALINPRIKRSIGRRTRRTPTSACVLRGSGSETDPRASWHHSCIIGTRETRVVVAAN